MARNSACCLSSINLSEFVINPYTDIACIDTEGIVHAVEVGIATLDKLIDENYTRHPLKEQQDMSFNYRNVGLGCLGYATMLMKLGLTYGSDKALEFTDKLFALIFRAAVIKSNKLAKELGVFPKYKDCVWDSTIIRSHFSQKEIDMMKEYGLRNCSLLSIAPNGSTALILGESGGTEPQFALSFTRRTVGMTDGEDTYYKVYCKAVREYMDIHNCDESNLPEYFVTARDIPWINRVKTQGVIQKHIDTAISSTINLPESTTVEDIEHLYLESWRHELKGVTIFRENCKRMPILSTSNDKNEKSNIANNVGTSNGSTLPRGYVIETSDNWVGMKRKIITGCGSTHICAYFDKDNGDLRECFISKGSTGGCNSNLTALSRMISIASRGGIDIHDIVDQLKSAPPCVSYVSRTIKKCDTSNGMSCPSAIANALMDMYNEYQDYIACDYEESDNEPVVAENKEHVEAQPVKNHKPAKDNYNTCPECGATLAHEGGCVTCHNCGYSKCG